MTLYRAVLLRALMVKSSPSQLYCHLFAQTRKLTVASGSTVELMRSIRDSERRLMLSSRGSSVTCDVMLVPGALKVLTKHPPVYMNERSEERLQVLQLPSPADDIAIDFLLSGADTI